MADQDGLQRSLANRTGRELFGKTEDQSDVQNSHDEYVVSFKRLSNNADVEAPRVASSHLPHYPKSFTAERVGDKASSSTNEKAEHDSRFRYLLFSHILTNDVNNASLLLEHINTLLQSHIDHDVIERMGRCDQQGVIQRSEYRKLFAEVKEKSAQIEHQLKVQNRHGYLPMYCSVDLLVLTCMLKRHYDSPKMLEVVIGHINNINENTFTALICHPVVDCEVVTLLVTDAFIIQKSKMTPECKTTLLTRLMFGLSSFYCERQNLLERQMTKTKIEVILSMFNTNKENGQLCDAMYTCLALAIRHRDSSLFQFLIYHTR